MQSSDSSTIATFPGLDRYTYPQKYSRLSIKILTIPKKCSQIHKKIHKHNHRNTHITNRNPHITNINLQTYLQKYSHKTTKNTYPYEKKYSHIHIINYTNTNTNKNTHNKIHTHNHKYINKYSHYKIFT